MYNRHFPDIDECVTNKQPCQNGATCNNLQNAYTCTCIPGWQGTNCDKGMRITLSVI
ncbi:hypothetical protein DPMN_159271 [Dreissena polymorpha]|uniref:EGF-like domain-containing protein n=1 Tax=Dreissena polymorpha TaxID=45954 RepID=A0A9D4IRM6_DREPO|nr:hypothetical protein DPMN_159271 [Dreissena polymorpha]